MKTRAVVAVARIQHLFADETPLLPCQQAAEQNRWPSRRAYMMTWGTYTPVICDNMGNRTAFTLSLSIQYSFNETLTERNLTIKVVNVRK